MIGNVQSSSSRTRRLAAAAALAALAFAPVAGAQSSPRASGRAPAASAAPAATDGAITIRSGERRWTLSARELAALPRREARIPGRADSSTVSGVLLWDVLQAVGLPPATASGRQRAVGYVRLTGADGQSALLALVEVDPSFSSRRVLLVDRRDGNALDPVEGPWRAIVPDDLRHARWVRGVVSITLGTLDR